MPFLTVKLMPGVRLEQTPLLLQAGIIDSNLIRFRDGLAEKVGGWQRASFLSNPDLAGTLRELWAWTDFSKVDHLATGGDQGLFVPTDLIFDLTPQFMTDNLATSGFSTTAGSALVSITDPALAPAGLNPYSSVTIDNHITIGGNLTLFGQYAIANILSTTGYQIAAPAPALTTSSVSNPAAVASFTTTAGSEFVTVTLPNHGLTQGRGYLVQVPVTLTGSGGGSKGDVVISGAYTVLLVIDANNFTIGASTQAVATVGPIAQNGGAAAIVYWKVPAPQQPFSGWGNPGWGMGGWGTGLPPPPIVGTKLTAGSVPWGAGSVSWLDWCLTNFGEQLIAQPEGGPFFVWSPHSGLGTMQTIPSAPAAATGFFLAMPQQQLVAFGASTGSSGVQDPMLIRWCDNADYTDWTASASNQAGSFRLPRGSRIVGALQSPQQAMLWTDIGFWLMTYIGYPDVWGFAEVAQGCGLIGKKAVGVCGGQVFWMSHDRFWTYAGGQVQPLPCEVWDSLFQNLNRQAAPDGRLHIEKIRCVVNTGFDEVMWFFPSGATKGAAAVENDSYVKFNRVTGEWDLGNAANPLSPGGGLKVSDGLDQNVFGTPLWSFMQPDGSSMIMQMEMGENADTQPLHWWFRTGLFLLSEGEDFIFVDRLMPDFKWRKYGFPQTNSAVVQITLYTQDEPDNPKKPPNVYGPFSMTNASGPIDPRARGRYFSMKIEGSDLGSFTRLGAVKFRFAPDGRSG